jgi:hypothetical protein
MANATTDDIIAHGMEASKLALEYVMNLVTNPAKPTEDEQRAVVVAIASCIAGLNTKLLLHCNPDVYRESQDMILRFMEAGSQGIKKHIAEQDSKE